MGAVYRAGRNWHTDSNTNEGHGVSLSEWEKLGWTYHAKGNASAGYVCPRSDRQQVSGFLRPPQPSRS
jgi:hypothetical protein